MLLSTREAARRWGVSRATLQRHINAGKLSQSTDADGTKGIDPAEMVRVYGEPSRPKSASNVPAEATAEPLEKRDPVTFYRHSFELMKAEADHLKALLVEKDQRISDLQNAVHLLGHDAQPKAGGWWPFKRRPKG
ncbi:MAG: helix-turn-helix domain-containing protein [Nocardioidaceae bacterium]